MSKSGESLTFQEMVLRLHRFWASQGALIWRPYNVQVGAGTGNPATLLRVLGPEPWRVAYLEPSIRPDDGRYGENPNRMQMHYQYQVILKPDPGNPQELYLASLEAIGLDLRHHDVRFVEDNWKSPALGAWGLGWEVWLDGQEITQFTYFQQAGGLKLEPVSVELTYGLERILMAIQGVDSVWELEWMPGITYGELHLQSEIEHCRYYFDVADVKAVKQVYDIYESESRRALEQGLVIPAYDYVLKCSHLFNVLDTRGAIGVTERAAYFGRMAAMTRDVAKAYVAQREELGHPFKKMRSWQVKLPEPLFEEYDSPPTEPADVLLEVGTEEIPARYLDSALDQLAKSAPELFDEYRLDCESIRVMGTPRRLVLLATGVAPRQRDVEHEVKGPPVERAFDPDGKPTKAALGFARSKGVPVEALERREMDGGHYVVARVRQEGKPTPDVLAELFPRLIGSIHFDESMRWNSGGVAFSRPIRWLVALFGGRLIPFSYANAHSGRITRGVRVIGSDAIRVSDPDSYLAAMQTEGIILDRAERRAEVERQARTLAEEVGGVIPDDPDLVAEVANLVERPKALRGRFEERYLSLPRDVLIAVMRKHQRYFPVLDSEGNLMPYFITVRNGDDVGLDLVREGNEHVIRARFADAEFFVTEDLKRPLEEYLPRLATLTFQEKLGSMLDKAHRIEKLTPVMAEALGLNREEIGYALRAAHLAKADLATQMVIEMTSLQGIMGREYALRQGEPEAVAVAIFEHYLPRFAGDALPQTGPGITLALLDRLDSLIGLFAIGLIPTGAKDPFALRRAALGVVQILLGHGIDLDLRQVLSHVAEEQPVPVSDEARADVIEFVAGRLKAMLLDEGHAYDAVDAVLAAQGHNPHRARLGVEQLEGWVRRDDWQTLLDAYARCARIIRDQPRYDFNPDGLVEEASRELYEAYREAANAFTPEDNVDGFLRAFEPMVKPITRFFDDVLVMAEDEKLRHNRLALLQRIVELADGIADLSRMEGF